MAALPEAWWSTIQSSSCWTTDRNRLPGERSPDIPIAVPSSIKVATYFAVSRPQRCLARTLLKRRSLAPPGDDWLVLRFARSVRLVATRALGQEALDLALPGQPPSATPPRRQHQTGATT